MREEVLAKVTYRLLEKVSCSVIQMLLSPSVLEPQGLIFQETLSNWPVSPPTLSNVASSHGWSFKFK
jgi:hypothetical protein